MELSSEEIKKKVGVYAADLVKSGMQLGLGTGTTVYYLIHELGRRMADGLSISVVPTSRQTAGLATQVNIPLTTLEEIDQLDLTIDGADEIDADGNLIKGGGGALLQEKIVAASSRQLFIIADHTKKVEHLGRFPLPVEVITFGYSQVIKKILASGYCDRVELRKKDGKVFVTDHHHYILDCYFKKIANPVYLNEFLHLMPGVVETGLFNKMASQSIIGYPDGTIETFDYHQ